MKKNTKTKIFAGVLALAIVGSALIKIPVRKITVVELEVKSITQTTGSSIEGKEWEDVYYIDNRYSGVHFYNPIEIISKDGSSTWYNMGVDKIVYEEGEPKKVSANIYGKILDDSEIKRPYVMINGKNQPYDVKLK